MSKFLSSFIDMKGSAPPPSFTKFKRIVDSGEYEDAYGDIPRRPLFLQMLAEDAWEGYAPEEKLFRLYGKYFRAKMKRDWIGADTPGKTLRNNILLKKFGIEEAQEQIISMMERFSSHCIRL